MSLGTLPKPVPTSNFAEFARSHLTTVDFVHTVSSTNVQLLGLLLGTLLLVRNRSANRKSSKNRKWNSPYVCVMILLPAPAAASIKVTASTANPAATEQYLLAKKQLNDLAQPNLEAVKIRAKACFMEEGEQSTRYFYSLKQRRQADQTIHSLTKDNLDNFLNT